jgi:hypothetical protein
MHGIVAELQLLLPELLLSELLDFLLAVGGSMLVAANKLDRSMSGRRDSLGLCVSGYKDVSICVSTTIGVSWRCVSRWYTRKGISFGKRAHLMLLDNSHTV